jgi:crotonobetainyl-CoA:carnitine CoA-transferase CaiB-like acyl-CoA transferase
VTGALRRVRIVSMALNAPGPLAVARLAAEGASVTKIEPPSGDPLAEFCRSLYDELHQQVSVERMDLKTPEGHARLLALLANADLFISSQRPSALARLGLTEESLSRVRWVNIVGERAQPEIAGHDLTYLARAGLLDETLPRSLMADVMGSERAFSAALLLLRQPPGAHLDVGLYDSLDSLLAPLRHGLTAPGALLGGGLPAYGLYDAKEGRVAIAALEPHFRKRLYSALALADGSDLSAAMRTRTAEEWERWAADHDLPMAAVRTGHPR